MNKIGLIALSIGILLPTAYIFSLFGVDEPEDAVFLVFGDEEIECEGYWGLVPECTAIIPANFMEVAPKTEAWKSCLTVYELYKFYNEIDLYVVEKIKQRLGELECQYLEL